MRTSGFSLLELSIVLVIIGLLAGGVMTGQSLIHAAELRSVSTDYLKYQTALHAFRDKYRAFPGDMKNATKFWGIAGGTTGADNACYDVVSTSAPTCDGDGNGHIGEDGSVGNETLRAWQHLADAGLIEGTFTGRADGASGIWFHSTAGVNVPAGKYPQSGYSFYYLDRPAGMSSHFPVVGNIFFIGAKAGSDAMRNPVFTPSDAWNIDQKLDDGKPGLGMVMVNRGSNGTSTGCVDSATPATAAYSYANDGPYCFFVVKLGLN